MICTSNLKNKPPSVTLIPHVMDCGGQSIILITNTHTHFYFIPHFVLKNELFRLENKKNSTI